jgi:hypothetical protein
MSDVLAQSDFREYQVLTQGLIESGNPDNVTIRINNLKLPIWFMGALINMPLDRSSDNSGNQIKA